MIRRIICVLLSVLLLVSFSACNRQEEKGSESSKEQSSAENSLVNSKEESSAEESSTEESANALIGTWYAADHSLMLETGGEGVYCKDGEFFELTWKAEGDSLILNCEDKSLSLGEQAYSLSEDGKSLTVGDTVYSATQAGITVTETDPALIGTWYNYDAFMGEKSISFNEDGSGMLGGSLELKFEWYTAEGTLTIIPDISDLDDTLDMTVVAKYSTNAEGELILSFGGEIATLLGGEKTVYTKTKRELGGNEALVKDWVEYEWDASTDEMYGYEIEFSADGTGTYYAHPNEEDVNYYRFIWEEKDGIIKIELVIVNVEGLIAADTVTAEVSYTLEDDCLTIVYNGTETKYKPYESGYDTGVDMEHPLGGDEAVHGTWAFVFEDDDVKYTEQYIFNSDGSFERIFDEFSAKGSWYTDGGKLVAYEGDGYAPLMCNYSVNGDCMDTFDDYYYTRLVREDSGKRSYTVYLYPATMDEMNEDLDLVFLEEEGEKCVTFYADTDLEELCYYSLEQKEDGSLALGEELYRADSLLAFSSLFLSYPSVENAPAGAVSFKDPNGDIRRFAISAIDEYEVKLEELN